MQIRLKRGLDIAVSAAPEQRITSTRETARVAIRPGDYRGLRPVLDVGISEHVRAGQALLHDRGIAELVIAAPVSGVVRDIRRGSKRKILEIVIERSDADVLRFPKYSAASIGRLNDSKLRDLLLRTGAWSALRARPFDHIASPHVAARALFVTAIDTNPLAPDPAVVLRDNGDAFAAGILALSRLTRGSTYVCVAMHADIPVPESERIRRVEIAGPHPAGLPGTHLNAVGLSVSREPDLWHIGYQDVAAIGRMLLEGCVDGQRVIAIAGPAARTPHLARTLIGADLIALTTGQSLTSCRIISGCPLHGDEPARFLGRYHNQVTLLPGKKVSRGDAGAMLPLESIERVWPFRQSPLPLLRALLSGDTEAAEALGCLGLAEDDLALCSHVCAGHNDYGSALRRTLDAIERDA